MSTAIDNSPSPATVAPSRTYSRWTSLAVLCAGTLMTILDGNIVTVAMPAIQSDLGFSGPGLAWVVNAYLIAFGGLLLLVGRMGDLVGRKRMFTSGLAVFTAASVLCGTATGQGVLIAARALQGVGGRWPRPWSSACWSLSSRAAGTGPRHRGVQRGRRGGRALGTFLGGALTQALNWHWIFLINLPIGAVAWLAAVRVLAPERGGGLGRVPTTREPRSSRVR
ncbi:MFS transporter [Streptomyces diastatochromogenes]|nr:MFS transporter [Streptomyces diastatochromogenes]